MSHRARRGRIAAFFRTGRRRIAFGWAVAAFLLLSALGQGAGAPGVSSDEAAVLDAAGRAGAFWSSLPAHPLSGMGRLDAAFGGPRPQAPLLPAAAAATHAVGTGLGLGPIGAYRLAGALAGALLAALLALLAHDLRGPAAALLAPAIFLAAPRHLHLAATATPDVAAAALWVAVAWAYRRAAAERDRRERLRTAALAGLAFGGALAARLDAWVLLPALGLHALVVGLLRPQGTPGFRPGVPGRAGAGAAAGAGASNEDAGAGSPVGLEARLHGVPVAVAAMAVLGPLVLLAAWPWLWADPLGRLAAAASTPLATFPFLGERLDLVRAPHWYPLAVTVLTLPAAALVALAGGVVQALARLVRGVRGAPGVALADEVLLLVLVGAPVAASAVGVTAPLGGVRPWLPALAFASVLGARAVLSAAHAAWPGRAGPLAATLALLVVWPAARQATHAWPHGGSAWSELAGGAPGAASRGLQRQDGGEAARAALALLGERARPGARVLLVGAAAPAVPFYAAEGALPAGLAFATGLEDADLAVVTLDGGSRDAEYRVWAAFRTARPSAGVFLDEVPLALVYARPGAWR